MSKIFKLENTLIFNLDDIESYYIDNELDQYNLKLVINMKSGNHIITNVEPGEFEQFHKAWSERGRILAKDTESKYKKINDKTKPFIHKNLVIREPESIKALDLIQKNKYENQWYIWVICDYAEFSILSSRNTPEEREKEVKGIYNRLRKWAGFPEQLQPKEEKDD